MVLKEEVNTGLHCGRKTGSFKDYNTGFNAPNLRFFIVPYDHASTD